MLIIKGCYYFDKKNDEVLRSHYSGDYWAVDCDRYCNKKNIVEMYDYEWFKEVKDRFIKVNGKKYYEAEWGPIHTSDLIELSDINNVLSTIEYFDDATEFEY